MLMLLCIGIPSIAQTYWRHTRPVTSNLFQLRAISSADSLHSVAVGFDGIQITRAVRTTNGGHSWSTVLGDSTQYPGGGVVIKSMRFYDVAHPTPDLILVVADSVTDRKVGSVMREELRGVILRSNDGGGSWTSTLLDSAVSASSISMSDPQHGLVKILGGMLRTTNGGESWTHLSYPDSAMRSAVDLQAVTSSSWIVFGLSSELKRGAIFRTTDAGTTWTRSSDSVPPLSRIRFVDSLLGWGVGGYKVSGGSPEQAVIARTVDGGMTWVTQLQRVVGMGGGLSDIAFLDRQNGLAVGKYAKLLRTSNGGDTWEVEQSDVSEESATNFLAVSWPATETAMISTLNGYVLRYEANGIPALPFITNPVNKSKDQPLSVLIQWTVVSGAVAYDLQISEGDAGFITGVIVSDSGLTSTSRAVQDLMPNATYAIRVRAITATDTSNWSSLQVVHTFTTGDDISNITYGKAPEAFPLQAWPNPVRSNDVRIRMQLLNGSTGEVRVVAYDLRGRVVLDRMVPMYNIGEISEGHLDTDSLPAGSYQLVVEERRKMQAIRIVVIR